MITLIKPHKLQISSKLHTPEHIVLNTLSSTSLTKLFDFHINLIKIYMNWTFSKNRVYIENIYLISLDINPQSELRGLCRCSLRATMN